MLKTGSFTDNTQDVRVLNYFVVTAQEVFDGVEIVTATQSQAGSYFIGAIYDTTEMFAGTSLSSPIAETEIQRSLPPTSPVQGVQQWIS